MNISIDNTNFDYHYEIIESIIHKYNIICNINKKPNDNIYLENIVDKYYIKYIEKNYPNIKINQNNIFDKKIYTTFYSQFQNKFQNELNNPDKYYFISHNIHPSLDKYKNIFYLTPLCNSNKYIYTDILPQIIKKNTKVPIYIIQGKFIPGRREYDLLLSLFQANLQYPYKIKLIGGADKNILPNEYKYYKSKIIIKNELKFEEYHQEFSDCYALLTLISKKNQNPYYKRKLTSSINYIRAYNLKAIIDQDLQNIYQLPNVEIYPSRNEFSKNDNDYKNGFIKAFQNSLEEFYRSNQNTINNNININIDNNINIDINNNKNNEINSKNNYNIIIDHQNQEDYLEFIEYIIHNYDNICKLKKNKNNIIYLEKIKNLNFLNYIQKKYPTINLNTNCNKYDIKIYSAFSYKNISKYKKELNITDKYFFIFPFYNDTYLKNINNNTLFFIPINLNNSHNFIKIKQYSSYLEQKNTIPIYGIQTDLYRKNYNLLYTLLKMKLPYEYKIKLISTNKFILPEQIKQYSDKLIIKNNLNFENYYNEISSCYMLIPLISIDNEPDYYTNIYMPTLFYSQIFNKKCIIDEKLQNIYQLSNMETFIEKNNIWVAFKNTLQNFYK